MIPIQKTRRELMRDVVLDYAAARFDGCNALATRAAMRLHEIRRQGVDSKITKLLSSGDLHAVVNNRLDELVELIMDCHPDCGRTCSQGEDS